MYFSLPKMVTPTDLPSEASATLDAMSMPEDVTPTSAVVATYESRYQEIKKNHFETQQYATALNQFLTLWQEVQASPMSPEFRAKVAYATAVTSRRLGDEISTFEFLGLAMAFNPNDPQTLCDYAELGAKLTQDTATFDDLVHKSFSKASVPTSTASGRTYLCLSKYATSSQTIGKEWYDIANLSCQKIAKLGEKEEAASCQLRMEQRRGDELLGQSRFEEASTSFLSAMKVCTENCEELFEGYHLAQAEIHYQSAMQYLNQQDFTSAMTAFETALAYGGEIDKYRQTHQFSSTSRIAATLATQDYSRIVGYQSLGVFKLGLDLSRAHLNRYPNDPLALRTFVYCNWRVQEALGRFDLIITPEVKQLEAFALSGSSTRLKDVYLLDVALSYTHAGKGLRKVKGKELLADGYFIKAEDILRKILARRAEVFKGQNSVLKMNMNEVQLSLGWHLWYKDLFEEAVDAFAVLTDAKRWTKKEVTPKELMEAYRGMGNGYDEITRDHTKHKRLDEALGTARQAVRAHMIGILVENEWVRQPKASAIAMEAVAVAKADRLLSNGGLKDEDVAYIASLTPAADPHFTLPPDLAEVGDYARLAEQVVEEGYGIYINTPSKGVSIEAFFNLAISYHRLVKALAEKTDDPKAQAEAKKGYGIAAGYFTQLIELAPEHPEFYRFRGADRLALGLLRSCIADEEEALRRNTENPHDARNKLIAAYNHMIGDIDTRRKAGITLGTDELREYPSNLIQQAYWTMQNALTNSQLRPAAVAALQAAVAIEEVCQPDTQYVDGLQLLQSGMLFGNQDRASQTTRDRLAEILTPCLDTAFGEFRAQK